MDSPVDVGGFAEPRKILCLGVLYLRLSKYQYTPGPRMGEPEFPYKQNTCLHLMELWKDFPCSKQISRENVRYLDKSCISFWIGKD